MRRDYGSRLFQRIDLPLTGDLVAEIYADVVDALYKYEPRVKVNTVTVVSATAGHLILGLTAEYVATGEIININEIIIK